MRTLLLLMVIVSAYAAEPRSNGVIVEEVKASREVMAAEAALDQAECAYVDALVAIAESLDIHPLPVPDIGSDPRKSEQDAARVITDYNDLATRALASLRRYKDKNVREPGWRHGARELLVCIKVRNERAMDSGLIPKHREAGQPAPKPKSQITATLPDGTMITSGTPP